MDVVVVDGITLVVVVSVDDAGTTELVAVDELVVVGFSVVEVVDELVVVGASVVDVLDELVVVGFSSRSDPSKEGHSPPGRFAA